MEVTALLQVVDVDVVDGHLRHSAGPGKDVTGLAVMQNDGDASGGLLRTCAARGVDLCFVQAVECNSSKRIGPGAGDEANFHAEGSDVVREDARRAAEG